MLYTMLCLVLLAFTLTGLCGGDSDNSSSSPMSLLPPVPASRRMSAAQVHLLRRQLMRDNYDYQHSADEKQPNITARSGGDTKFYHQKGGTDQLPRASELAQASDEYSALSDQQEHYKQREQLEQPGQQEQGRQYKQNGEYEHQGQHEHRGQYEQDRHHNQPGEYEHRDQYQQPGEHEQRGQYRQPGEHEQRGQYEQHDQYEQHGTHKQRGQRKQHGQHQEREQREQRGQNKHREQREQLGQFDEQEQAQSIERKPRAPTFVDDAPVAPPVAVPFTDELNMRDIFEREYTPDRRDIEPDQAKEYNSSYYNKRRDAYDLRYPTQMQRRPFSKLRSNYKEQYGQNDAGYDMRAQEELASNAQDFPDEEYAPEEQEAFDQQDVSGSQDEEESDFSVSKKQPRIYNEFVKRSTTRANRLHTLAPAERNAPLHRVHNSLSYHDRNIPPPHRKVPPPHRNVPPPHRNVPQHYRNERPLNRNAPPPHRNAPDHNISKKDLLYYMDDNQLRRRNNDASPDVLDEDQLDDDQLPSPQPGPGPNNPAGKRTSPGKPARHPAHTEGRSGGELRRTPRPRRSFVVTVSAANVTYKILTLKSRSGRRQDERRILEEHGPAGVAIMSLDHAPLPGFRLPRARRQYMHVPHHHRRHEPA